jgi:hypothetical protein
LVTVFVSYNARFSFWDNVLVCAPETPKCGGIVSLSLSRSSELYKFVFGKNSRWFVHGLPEPRGENISSGLFGGMLLVMAFIRVFAFIMLAVFDLSIRILSFLADGSYMRGIFPEKYEIKAIKPWPTFRGWRFSPWILLVACIISYQYFSNGAFEAFQWFFFLALWSGVFLNTSADSPSPAMTVAEAMTPHIDESFRNGYYGEPRVFPAVRLVK